VPLRSGSTSGGVNPADCGEYALRGVQDASRPRLAPLASRGVDLPDTPEWVSKPEMRLVAERAGRE
jgi:hypothetical protein